MPESARSRRAVVIVPNPLAPYSRGLRVARSLADAGWEVEIAAQPGPGLPAEETDGSVVIRRWQGSGPWVDRLARRSGTRGIGRRILMKAHRALALILPWARRHPPPTTWEMRTKLFWPTADRHWWHTIERDVAPADLYHACGYRAIRPALAMAATARRHGRQGRVIYDAIDIALQSNTFISRHPFWRWLYQRRERAWVNRADEVITTNDAFAGDLERRLRLGARPLVLLNTPPRWSPPASGVDLIRKALDLPAEQRIVLYLGRLVANRGLDEAAAAVGRVDRAVLVLVGFGQGQEQEQARAKDPRFGGRHFTLPPVHPDDVPAWAASADVTFAAPPPTSLNQRLFTPNKFWESLAGGTPVVVARASSTMRAIVEREHLGVVVDSEDVEDVAAGLRAILDADPVERAALRARCLGAAHDHYNWETSVQPYLALVERLAGPPAGRVPSRRAASGQAAS